MLVKPYSFCFQSMFIQEGFFCGKEKKIGKVVEKKSDTIVDANNNFILSVISPGVHDIPVMKNKASWLLGPIFISAVTYRQHIARIKTLNLRDSLSCLSRRVAFLEILYRKAFRTPQIYCLIQN